MTKVELHRLAGAIATLRPDWAPQSLQTFLERNFTHRPYRDIAIALVTVAVDPTTATPARVLEPGPWWQAASTRDTPAARNTCDDHPLAAIRTDPRTGEQTCGGCHADRTAAAQPLPLRQRGVAPTPEVRAQLVAAFTRSDGATASEATPTRSTGNHNSAELAAAVVVIGQSLLPQLSSSRVSLVPGVGTAATCTRCDRTFWTGFYGGTP